MSRIGDTLKKLKLPGTKDDYLHEVAELESEPYLIASNELRDPLKAKVKTMEDGLGLPFHGLSLLKFMPGRWSLWAGTTFGGKTQFLRFLMTHAMLTKGVKCLFVSLEEESVQIVKEFCALALSVRTCWTDDAIDVCMDAFDEKLYIFNHTGFAEPEVVIGAAILAAKRLGVTHVVIDSLMMLSIRKDDFEAQKDLGMLLNRTTQQLGIHIHLVAHPRKGSSSQDEMDLYDIQGAQDLVALAHTTITLQRAPSNDKKRKEWGITDGNVSAVLRVWKQRGDWNMTGTLFMFYLANSRQWVCNTAEGPRLFLPKPIYKELGINLVEPPNFYDQGFAAPQQSAF